MFTDPEQELLPTSSNAANEDDSLIEIPENPPKLSYTLERQEATEIIKVNVEQCENLSVAHKFLMTAIRKADMPKKKGILVVKIRITEHFVDFNEEQLKDINKKYAKISIIIFLESELDEKFLIYWKSSECQQFLSLKPYRNAFLKDDKLLCEYVVEFLKKSLKKGYLGE